MTTYLTFRTGAVIRDPTEPDMRAALADLANADDEHPDCWLADENGWGVSVFQSGLVILENAETGEGPWHMRGIKAPEVLVIWGALQAGQMDIVRSQKWRAGYGDDAWQAARGNLSTRSDAPTSRHSHSGLA